MPAPTSYTEQTFAEYMHTILGDVAEDLGLVTTNLGDYQESVYEALFTYGEPDITKVTGTSNIARLRSIGRVEAWRLATGRAAARYDEADGTQKLERSQLLKHCKELLDIAESDLAQYGTSDYAVAIDPVDYVHDPYAYWPDDVRVRP